MGPLNVLIVFALKDLVGLVLVLGQATCQRRLGALARNSAVVFLNLIHIRHDFTEVPPELFAGKTVGEVMEKATRHFTRHVRGGPGEVSLSVGS